MGRPAVEARRPGRRHGLPPTPLTPAGGRSQELERVVPALTGADAHDLVDRGHPHLPVADLPGRGGLDHGVDHTGGVELADDHLDADLRHEVHLVLRPAVDLGVTPLTAEALDLADGQTGDADQLERVLDVVQLERLDDRGDQLHTRLPSVLRASACAWPASDVPPPPPSEAKSYAVSACSPLSMPAISSSPEIG